MLIFYNENKNKKELVYNFLVNIKIKNKIYNCMILYVFVTVHAKRDLPHIIWCFQCVKQSL